MAEIPLWAIGALITLAGGFVSLAVLVATSFIKSSYSRVSENYVRLEASLAKFEATLTHLNTHATIHEEWRKTVDAEIRRLHGRIGPLERKVFGTVRQDDTPSPREER